MQRSSGLTMMLLIMMVSLMIFMYFQQRPVPLLPKPEIMLQQARESVKEAGDEPKKLRAALQIYDQLANSREYRNTEYAAQALLEKAIVLETKLGDEHQAISTYNKLLDRFSPEKSQAAAEGRRRLAKLEKEYDKRNSKHTLYKIVDFFVALTGRNPNYSYALALLIITVIFKVITWPLSHAQFRSMKQMQRIQPMVKQIQEKYKDNQKEMGEKLMALYREQGVNPFASCLPLLVQLPVLWVLYYMVRLYQYQFAQGKFLWIGSRLAEKYPSIVGGNLSEPDIPLVILYVISMFISQRLTVVDPTQAEQQKIMAIVMPLMFGFLFYSFPSAFMLYWLIFNIVSTAQQVMVLKGTGPEEGQQPPSGVAATQQVELPTRVRRTRSRPSRRRRHCDRLPVGGLLPVFAT
ncbi:MAG: YidC/Oxa1 family membrane protein insertase [Armatimonadota bacterium]|nr:YidC/Oxa1 family membrane protein insertase [Armatimonadota bacterium]